MHFVNYELDMIGQQLRLHEDSKLFWNEGNEWIVLHAEWIIIVIFRSSANLVSTTCCIHLVDNFNQVFIRQSAAP